MHVNEAQESRMLIRVIVCATIAAMVLVGCSAAIDRWSQVDGRGTVAKAAYMAAFRKIQQNVCFGDSLLVARARIVREENGVYLRFDCARVAAEGASSE